MFAKIFAQIFDSSIAADSAVRHVFMDLLVLADRDGVVDMTLDAISRRTNVSQEVIAHAVAELMREDRSSRSHEENGRRLVPIDSHRDWGWQIVNYEHYRNIKDDEARRTYFRDKKREQRNRSVTPALPSKRVLKSPRLSNSVKDSPTQSNNVTQAEADTEAKKKDLLLPAVIRLPATAGKDYAVTQKQLERWEELYPGVDVKQSLRNMVGWLESDHKRRKTTGGMARFVTGWLAKEQNRGTQVNRSIQNQSRNSGDGDDESGEAGHELFDALYGPVG